MSNFSKEQSPALEILEKSFRLAKNEKIDQAKELLAQIEKEAMSPNEMRLLAKVTSRCELFEENLRVWLKLEMLGEVEVGDRYMQGIANAELSKFSDAIFCFEREVSFALKTGDDFFLRSSAFLLASLSIELNDFAKAEKVLIFVENENDTFFVPNIGVQTKAVLLKKMKANYNQLGT